MTDNLKLNLLAGAAFIAMALIAPYSFADNINQSGAGNVIQSQSGAGNVQNNGGILGDGNNSPSLTATGGTAVATGGRADSSSHSTSRASADSFNLNSAKQHQGQGQTQSADNQGNNLSVEQNYQAQKRNPVNTAFATPLVAAEDTCMGSTSVGGQGVGFGLSVGSTWQDADCVRRKDARELHNMGHQLAGISLMCQNANVAKAMATAGTPCPGNLGDLAPSANQSSNAEATASVSTAPRWHVRAIDRY